MWCQVPVLGAVVLTIVPPPHSQTVSRPLLRPSWTALLLPLVSARMFCVPAVDGKSPRS